MALPAAAVNAAVLVPLAVLSAECRVPSTYLTSSGHQSPMIISRVSPSSSAVVAGCPLGYLSCSANHLLRALL